MNNKTLYYTVLVLVAILFLYFIYRNDDLVTNTPTQIVATTTTGINNNYVGYRNTKYGFSLQLPISWENFTATETSIAFGNSVTIRNSAWSMATPTADIPVLIYPINQWETWVGNDFQGYPTAAPIGPTERGRNETYVFATAPRYNFSFLPGFEGVEEILKNLVAF